MSNYNQLKDVLNDIFELNKADLDFGIYRIINQKRKQVNEFIDKQLPADIKTALSETQTSDKAELENELKTLKKNLENAGVVADETPKYRQLNERLTLLDNTEELEQEVFSHLANFFRRYYKDGDFISMRRYKKDVYAIPYEGEEVKLHWANADQYYIKSSENFKNYAFILGDGTKVTFQLKEVSTEQNNNKTQGEAERRFAIYEEMPVEEIEGELLINFVYEPFPKATKQDALLATAISLLTENVPTAFAGVFALSPTEKNPRRTLLEKHLTDYVSKNSFDYFIHKDLGGFLSRELDFYIKNEVLYLDDINVKQTDFFVAQLSKVKAIKTVATKVIDFLAQIENFQKKLWLKKKFILRTDYCITLDRIPEAYYPEIFANKDQLVEWKTLFDVELQNGRQFAFEQYLVLDTKFFDETFKDRLLAEFDDLDEQTNGLLINSENFQALGLMQEKYHEKVDVTYIDPPYNTDATPILYKNEYRESTWLSLISDRLILAKNLFETNEGALSIAIDDAEIDVLKRLLKQCLFQYEIHKVIVNHYPGSGTGRSNVSRTHEYNLFAIPFDSDHLRGNLKEDGIRERNFRRAGTGENNYRVGRPNSFFALLVNKQTFEIVGIEEPPTTVDFPYSETSNGYKRIYPIGSDGAERVWSLSYEGAKKALDVKMLYCTHNFTIIRLYNDEGARDLVQSIWTNNKFNATVNGTNLLTDLFNNSGLFSYPKSVYTIKTAIDVIIHSKKHSIVLDYFAGSGTTGHATIKLNREDNGNRKYILVEMGTYFNTVTKPRIQKVIYSDNWKNGKPQDKAGISQIVKCQVFESYEDTLNNLYLNSPQNQSAIDFSERAQEEYLLQYMLEIESRDNLFNLEMFRKPFDYQLKITENNELKPTKVDLVETFNYLIGLYVNKVQRVKDIKVVEGITRTGIKTLVIWRDMETTTHEDVVKLVRRFYDSARTREFQQIYINGDHHLENLRSDGDQFKIKGIEETFFKKMFNESEL
ncbi:MAG: DNA methyltransferase [Bacteroidales bacterium]